MLIKKQQNLLFPKKRNPKRIHFPVIQMWFKRIHFQKLLGSPPNVEETQEEIPTVFSDLNIEDGPFTAAEYTKVKKALKLGKSSGPDLSLIHI